ncbi:membrane protein [Oceanobacillus picturae]|nr:membrane protein [Oceanobacillus picturae]
MVAIILVINIVYVSLSTVRMILTLKGRRYIAAFVSMFEIVIYVLGLGLVLDNLDAIQNLIAYAIGFGIGVVVGSKIEEKLALGYITVNVISSNPDIEFTRKLRDKGYGVTSWFAYGMDGDRLSMQILTPRKYELRLYETIKEIDPKAFIIAYEPKQIHGGFWVKQVRKSRLANPKKAAEAARTGGPIVPPVQAKPTPPKNTPNNNE